MEDDFVFPDRPADLCDPRCELPLRCVDLVDVSGLEREDLDEFVDRTSWEFFGSVFFSVSSSSSSSACFCFAAKRISTANSPENAHWFFSLSRMVSCGTRAAKELLSFARRARQWDRLATVFFSRPLPFSLTLDAVRRSLSTDETIPKKTGALYDVCNSDALSLLEQETFDRVYSLVR